MPPRLPLAFATLHGADQLSLAALPLIATLALGAGPGLTGLLLAAQGAAWLVVSLPAGVLADRMDRVRLLRAGAVLAALGFALAGLLAAHPAGLAAAAFLGSGGVVLAALAVFALVPGLVAREALPAANARLELGRAGATLAAPPLAGLLAEAGLPVATLGLAALAALLAWWAGGKAARPCPARPRPARHGAPRTRRGDRGRRPLRAGRSPCWPRRSPHCAVCRRRLDLRRPGYLQGQPPSRRRSSWRPCSAGCCCRCTPRGSRPSRNPSVTTPCWAAPG